MLAKKSVGVVWCGVCESISAVVSACACVPVRACMRVCMCVCVRPCVCARARVRANGGCTGTLVVVLRRAAVFTARPVTGGRTRVCFASATRPFAHVAAGASWTLVNANAPWAARAYHTTVIDATGAIYVIGGRDDSTIYDDVWVSTDGGADRTRRGYARGYSRGSR